MDNREDICTEVLGVINRLRASPSLFISRLEGMRPNFSGRGYRTKGSTTTLMTKEGVAAVEEAIRYLNRATPVGSLQLKPELRRTAQGWADDLGRRGATGHGDFSGRLRSALGDTFVGARAENIGYGSKDPTDIVLQWVVDDGVPDRGHRENLMSKDYKFAGLGFANHPSFGSVCVIDFSGQGSAKVEGQTQKNMQNVPKEFISKMENVQGFPKEFVTKMENVQGFPKEFVTKMEHVQGFPKEFVSRMENMRPDFGTQMTGMKKVASFKSSAQNTDIPESEWPKGYVGMSQKSQTLTRNGVQTTKVTYVFTMPDGQKLTREKETTANL